MADIPSYVKYLRDIWVRIPEAHCQGLCTDSCGPIDMSEGERRRLLARGVAMPPLSVEMLDPAYHCPALVKGRCIVYEDRPTICRLWGVVESMPCPYGCQPDRVLDDAEGYALVHLAEEARR
jgi:hypothetical protein